MTTNEPLSPNNAYRALRAMMTNSDDVYDMIAARLDDDFESIFAIDDRPETIALLDALITDRAFATSIINNDDLL